MLCAVTGGSGLVGRFTINELLARGHGVRNLDRVAPLDQSCPFYLIDVTDLGQLVNAFAGCDAIIHLAAIPTPYGYPSQVIYANNTIANYNVLEAAAIIGIKNVCMASSVNAIGLGYSIAPSFDYFPIDEQHRTRAEDCYSLSKWCGEQQADGFARRYPQLTLVSCRYHAVTPPHSYAQWRQAGPPDPALPAKHLWAYTDARDAARANRLAIEATWTGHQVLFIAAKDTRMETPTLELTSQHYPDVEVRGDLSGFASLFNCARAKDLLGWEHEHSWRSSE